MWSAIYLSGLKALSGTLLILPLFFSRPYAHGQEPPIASRVISESTNEIVGTPEEIALFNKRLENTNILAKLAQDYVKENEFDKAIEIYQQIILLNKEDNHHWACARLGDLYERKGLYNKSVAMYRTFAYSSVLVNPKTKEIIGMHSGGLSLSDQFKFAIALKRSGQNAEAMQVYNSGLKQADSWMGEVFPVFSPTNFNGRRFEAAARSIAGSRLNPDDAILECQKAIEMDEKFAPAYYILAEKIERQMATAFDRQKAVRVVELRLKAYSLGTPEMKVVIEKDNDVAQLRKDFAYSVAHPVVSKT